MGVFDPIIELSKGLGETLRSFWREPTVTFQYPEEKRPVRPRLRGRTGSAPTPLGVISSRG